MLSARRSFSRFDCRVLAHCRIKKIWLMVSRSQTVYGFSQGGKPVDPSELESFLDEYLVNQFATEADDNSPYEVLPVIIDLNAKYI